MKTYIITGATSGIGKALTEYFSKENIVYAGYRNEDKLDDLKRISSNIIPFYVDYAKPETISSAVGFIKSKIDNISHYYAIIGAFILFITIAPYTIYKIHQVRSKNKK